MRVVVTGGAGFIGANLVRVLVDDPEVDDVTVVDDLSTGSADNLVGVDARLLVGSITEPDVLDEALPEADAVVHLAARPSVPRSIDDPVATHVANATGTLQVLEAVRRHGHPYLVVASSSSVYGRNPELPKHEGLRPDPVSPYAASKLVAESYTLSHAEVYGLRALVFRFFNVFGPLQPAGHAYAAAVPSFIDAALAGRPVPVFGDGKQTRDFTFVGTVARVLTAAVKREVTDVTPVNLAFGTRRDLLEVIDAIADLLGTDVAIDHRPERPGDVRHSQADTDRLRGLFPDVQPVAFEKGLRATVDWFRSLVS